MLDLDFRSGVVITYHLSLATLGLPGVEKQVSNLRGCCNHEDQIYTLRHLCLLVVMMWFYSFVYLHR